MATSEPIWSPGWVMPKMGPGSRAEGCVLGGQGPTLNLSLILSQAQAPCTCRAHVEGPSCDRCKPGFWGLSPSNPEGCTRESAWGGVSVLGEMLGRGGLAPQWPGWGWSLALLPPTPLSALLCLSPRLQL